MCIQQTEPKLKARGADLGHARDPGGGPGTFAGHVAGTNKRLSVSPFRFWLWFWFVTPRTNVAKDLFLFVRLWEDNLVANHKLGHF